MPILTLSYQEITIYRYAYLRHDCQYLVGLLVDVTLGLCDSQVKYQIVYVQNQTSYEIFAKKRKSILKFALIVKAKVV